MIIEKYFSRDESVLRSVYEKYASGCLRLAMNICKNKQDAEEVVSDAILVTWNSIPPENPKSFTAYLYKTVRNLALTKYRDSHREKRRTNTDSIDLTEIEDLVPDSFCIDDQIEAKELGRIISDYLKNINEIDRNIFLCRYFHNMQIKDIKKNLGIGNKKINNSLYKTKEDLKKLLIKEGYHE